MVRFALSLTALLAATGLAFAQAANPAPITLPPSAAEAGLNSRVSSMLNSTSTANCQPAPVCESPECCPQWFFGAEYLYWQVQGQSLPPLVTTSPAGTPRGQAGVLGTPGAATLFGGHRVNDDYRSGLRLRAGYWFDGNQQCGIEFDYFALGDSSDGGQFGSPGLPIISRPFINAFGGEASQLVAFPGVLAGTVTVNAWNQFEGGSVLLRKNLRCDACGWVDLLVGYRYLGMTDDVSITENLTNVGQTAIPLGTRIVVRDHFHTENDFNGGVIGVAAMRRSGKFYLESRASVALGNTHQVTTITGSTTISVPGLPTVVVPGGLLAQPTNIGTFTRDAFAVVPEIGVKAGVQATEHMRLFVGYNWLLWSNVARAGDQIDRVVNPLQIPPAGVLVGPARPAFTGSQTSVFVHGVSVGVELRY